MFHILFDGAHSLAKAFQNILGGQKTFGYNEDAPRRCSDVKIVVPGWYCIDNACHHKYAGPKTCFYTSKQKEPTYCIVQTVERYVHTTVKYRA